MENIYDEVIIKKIISLIYHAFKELEIDLSSISNKSQINEAFRKITKRDKMHPDLSTDEVEKEKKKKNFIRFREYVDICEIAIEMNLIKSLISKHYPSSLELSEKAFRIRSINLILMDIPLDEDIPFHEDVKVEHTETQQDFVYSTKTENDIKNYEVDWEAYVTNENAYFSVRTAVKSSFISVIITSVYSVIVSILISIGTLLLLYALIAIVSASISFPIIGWIIGIIFFIVVAVSAITITGAVIQYLIKILSATGYPSIVFKRGWVFSILIAVILIFKSYNKADFNAEFELLVMLFWGNVILDILTITVMYLFADDKYKNMDMVLAVMKVFFYLTAFISPLPILSSEIGSFQKLSLMFFISVNIGYSYLFFEIGDKLKNIEDELEKMRNKIVPDNPDSKSKLEMIKIKYLSD